MDREPGPAERPSGWRPRRLTGFDYASADHAYFVTVRACAGTSPFSDERLAAAVVDSVLWMRSHRGVALYAYCLMPDHLHLLLRLPESDAGGGSVLGSVIGSVKQFTTGRSWEQGHRGPLWQARFHDHIVRRHEDGIAIARYILENPVRGGIVSDAEAYRWSGTPDPMV